MHAGYHKQLKPAQNEQNDDACSLECPYSGTIGSDASIQSHTEEGDGYGSSVFSLGRERKRSRGA